MPKRKAKAPQPAELTTKLIKWPKDWIARIDEQRGEVSFSDFVRQAVLDKIGSQGLSELPGWGGSRRGADE